MISCLLETLGCSSFTSSLSASTLLLSSSFTDSVSFTKDTFSSISFTLFFFISSIYFDCKSIFSLESLNSYSIDLSYSETSFTLCFNKKFIKENILISKISSTTSLLSLLRSCIKGTNVDEPKITT